MVPLRYCRQEKRFKVRPAVINTPGQPYGQRRFRVTHRNLDSSFHTYIQQCNFYFSRRFNQMLLTKLLGVIWLSRTGN